MIKKPLVSIILCVYKVEKYIGRCARSVFGQTYPNIEYIFVDDGSPDQSIPTMERILEEEFSHRKDRVRIIHQANKGLIQARSTGLAAAKGEYVLFIDPDDWCKTNLVEVMIRAAVEGDADMVICNYYYAYRYLNIPRREKRYASHQDMLRAMLCHHHFRGYLWDKLVRRELYTDPSRFSPQFVQCEDLIWTAQALAHARNIVYVRDRLIYYNRFNSNSVTRNNHSKGIETVRNTMGLYLHYIDRPDSPFKGIEEPVLQNIAGQILRMRAYELFDEYPVILQRCAGIIEKYPCKAWQEDIPLRDQKETRKLYDRWKAQNFI